MKAWITVMAAAALAASLGCTQGQDTARATGRQGSTSYPNASGTPGPEANSTPYPGTGSQYGSGSSSGSQSASQDTRYFMAPSNLKANDKVCAQGSTDYVAVSTTPRSIPDSEMMIADTCSNPDLNVYQRSSGAGGTSGSQSGMGTSGQASKTQTLYVKTGEGKYLQVKSKTGSTSR